jgi:PmbA protein
VVDQMLGGSAGISGDFSINVDLGYRGQKVKWSVKSKTQW